MKKILKPFFLLLILLLLIGGMYWGYRAIFPAVNKVRFSTESVSRGNIASTISATGTVEPEELVNVGAQVGGLITKFGTDTAGREVDYGSQVKAGSVLAHIDDSLYTVEVREAEAKKIQAEATIQSCSANIEQAKAELLLATSNWKRAQRLLPQKAIAQNEYDSCESAYATSKAAIAVNEAQLALAKAQLAGAIASLDRAVRNLGYCVITSPVDGVIIDRRVSIGQTVNSSMSAPSLFLIAKDLKKMQVWVSVNEADIGSIRKGMPVEFTVDTFPDRKFKGEVHKIRLNATMSQNVVTFVVEVATDNADGKLLPYLTANVKFILASRQNVLTVSNAALRYVPEPQYVAPGAEAVLAEVSAGKYRGGKNRVLWVLDGDKVRPEKITIGLSDGIVAEVTSGNLAENTPIVTGATIVTGDESSSSQNAGSPFMPKPPKRR